MPVALLAGGLATRLRPITQTVPKSMLVVAGRPFIFAQLELLQRQGVRRVVLCAGHLGEQIEAAVGDGAALGLSVSYSYDGPVLLGTGGALRRALPLLGERFFIMYGDSYLLCDYAAVQAAFEASGAPALMTVFQNGDRWDRSNVLFEDGVLRDYNKRSPGPDMRHIDYGLGAMHARVLAGLPADKAVDLADIYQDLAARGELAGFEVAERFYEIGSHAGLQEASDYLTTQQAR